MAAHATTVTEYCGILSRSRLIPESEVAALLHRWKQDGKGTDADVEPFRKYLVAKRFLTDYQAALVQRGRADGFFVGGYVILDRIGKGQSAGVYKAVHTSGQVVALKVMPRSRTKEPNVLTRFQREGRLLTQLDHPNVVRAFQVGQAGNIHFIVMEHLDGETLDEVLSRRKKLPAAEAVRLVYQSLQGLQHLHEKRMVHRDLKPANLMVTPPGVEGKADTTLDATVKILDIGIGREMFDEDSPVTQDIHLTTEGAILGTPDYLAPEQARDARSADVRADIYSLGCVLFHLIVGRPPFNEKNMMAQMLKHATEKLAPLATLVGGVPAGLQSVLDKLTAKKIEDRYQTPAEAAEALTPYLPDHASAAAAPVVLPAFKQWLETESSMEISADVRKPSYGAPGTGPAPALPASPPSAKIPKAPPRTSPPPPAPVVPPVVDDSPMIDVELVTLPPPYPPVYMTAPIVDSDDEDEEPRPLTDLDRRDFVMLGFGAGGVLAAIGLGYGLAKLLKKSPTDPDAKSPTDAPESPK